MIKTIARYTVLAGIFLIPVIPFIVSSSMFFPFITGKNFTFRIIVDVILAAWALLAILDPMYRPKRSLVSWAMLAFLVIIGIADVFGVDFMRSFWSNYERMEGFITLLHLGAYFVVAGSVLTTRDLWKQFFNVTIIASFGITLYAFSQLAGVAAIHQGDVRLDATLGNATYLAVYLLIHIFLILLCAYRERKHRWLASTYLCTALLESVALFYTGTRGAILGVIGGMLLAGLIIVIKGRAHPRLRKYSAIALVSIVVLAGGLFAARHSSLVKKSSALSRVANISIQDTTVQSRFLLWTKIGWNGFKERPLLGWGQDNFIVVFGKYYDPEMYKQEPWFDRAHNVFMDWLIAGGLLGLLGYLFLFASGLWVLWKGPLSLPEKAILTGLFAAYFFHNIFVFDNLVSYIYFVTLLAYLHARSLSEVTPTLKPASEDREGIYVVTGGAVALAVALIYFLNIPYIARSQTLIDALTLDYQGQSDAELATYEKALARGGLGLEEAKEQLSQSAIRVWGSDAPDETKLAFATAARKALEESVAHDPYNTRPLFFLGYLVSHTTSPEEGVMILKKALAINPERQNFLYEVAQIYIAIGKTDEAIAIFKEAYDTAPENEQALVYYAGALIFDGQIAAGEKVLIDHFGTTTVDNNVLFNAYVKQGRYKNVAAILVARLAAMAPNDDARTRAQLGLVYNELGNRAAAIEQLEHAIELDPAFSAQGAEIIDAIRAGKKVNIQ